MTDISDHAVLRFIERVYGVDIEKVRAEMDSPALAKAVEFGSRVLIGRHGERLVIRDGIVVTVIGKGIWWEGRSGHDREAANGAAKPVRPILLLSCGGAYG